MKKFKVKLERWADESQYAEAIVEAKSKEEVKDIDDLEESVSWVDSGGSGESGISSIEEIAENDIPEGSTILQINENNNAFDPQRQIEASRKGIIEIMIPDFMDDLEDIEELLFFVSEEKEEN